MLAMKCPRCGAPVPLCLAEPERARCAFCAHDAPVPDHVTRELRAAAEILAQHDASERQLRGGVRATLLFGLVLERVFIGLALAFLVPAGGLFLWLVYRWATLHAFDSAWSGAWAVALVPAVLVVGALAVVTRAALRKARRRVEQAAAAVPPEREGEPARCHVCGGPIATEGARGVVRCGYCESDNIVNPGVLASAKDARREVLEDYAAEVRRQSGGVPRVFGWGSLGLGCIIVLTPLLCGFTALLGVSMWVGFVASRPTPGNRYGFVDVPEEGRCVAWYNPYTERWERPRNKWGEPDIPIPEESIEEVALADLVGRRMRIRGRREAADVGVTSDPGWSYYTTADGRTVDGPDTLQLNGAQMTVSRIAPRGPPTPEVWHLCLVETEAGASSQP